MARPHSAKVPASAWAGAYVAWCSWVPIATIAAQLGCGESNVRERARVEGWPARRKSRGRRPLGPRVVVRCECCGGRHVTALGMAAACGGSVRSAHPERARGTAGEEAA